MLFRSKIYNSNGYTMAHRGEQMGTKTLKIINVKANTKDILEALNSFDKADLFITSGGMSDVILDLLNDKKLKVLFRGVAMAPAGMSAVSFLNQKPILHLSGLPMAAILGFEILGGAIIKKLYGSNKYHSIVAKLAVHVEQNNFSQKILPGFFDGEFFHPQKAYAGKINILNHCNGYALISKAQKMGDRVKFHPFLL